MTCLIRCRIFSTKRVRCQHGEGFLDSLAHGNGIKEARLVDLDARA